MGLEFGFGSRIGMLAGNFRVLCPSLEECAWGCLGVLLGPKLKDFTQYCRQLDSGT